MAEQASTWGLGRWWRRRPLDPKRFTDVMYVAKTIWAEARGEGREGMRLVAWVIRNRVEAPEFPPATRGIPLSLVEKEKISGRGERG